MKLRPAFITVSLTALAIAGCETEPATNVTGTSAILHGKGDCRTGMHLYWWFEGRDINPSLAYPGGSPGPWTQIGAKQRLDCGGDTSLFSLDSWNNGAGMPTWSGLWREHKYQFRIASQQDGNGEGVCDRNGSCAAKGDPAESTLSYDDFQTPISESGQTGQDYDPSLGSGSVSGEYACDYALTLDPQVIIGHPSFAQTQLNCRNDMDLKVTCRVQLWIGDDFISDVDYGHQSTGNFCNATSASLTITLGKKVGSIHHFYARLNNKKRSWTSGFRNKPHRGGCETYKVYVPELYGYRDVLHCWGKYGDPQTTGG
jgi:hypothetical protein